METQILVDDMLIFINELYGSCHKNTIYRVLHVNHPAGYCGIQDQKAFGETPLILHETILKNCEIFRKVNSIDSIKENKYLLYHNKGTKPSRKAFYVKGKTDSTCSMKCIDTKDIISISLRSINDFSIYQNINYLSSDVDIDILKETGNISSSFEVKNINENHHEVWNVGQFWETNTYLVDLHGRTLEKGCIFKLIAIKLIEYNFSLRMTFYAHIINTDETMSLTPCHFSNCSKLED